MIRALLAHASRYYGLGWGIRRAFEFITQTDFSGLSAGRYDVEGDRIYALIQEKTARGSATRRLKITSATRTCR